MVFFLIWHLIVRSAKSEFQRILTRVRIVILHSSSIIGSWHMLNNATISLIDSCVILASIVGWCDTST